MTTTIRKECIDTCNSFLRGERSAVETYAQAIRKYGDDPLLKELSTIRNEHAHAVTLLERNVLEMGGTPDTDSGSWGVFANAVQGSANLFGEESALEALQKGEEHGKKMYEEALEEGELLPECKTLVSTDLLPRILKHIATLERLEEAV